MTDEIIKEIEKLKEEKNAIILAHNYQPKEIQEIADFVGDSLELCIKASDVDDSDMIIFCGVNFMAETATSLALIHSSSESPTKSAISCISFG